MCRLDAHAPVPAGGSNATFWSVTRTAAELSVVCDEKQAPEGARCETGWRCIAVEGPLPFWATGILASLAGPLAEARISIFALSTFDTDFVLVQESDLARALVTLRSAGHEMAGAIEA